MHGYYPEMGEKRPEGTQIEAQLGHYGRHYFLKVAPGIVLAGRGVEFLGVMTAGELVPGSRYVGWSRYKVTTKAMERIEKAYKVSSESLL